MSPPKAAPYPTRFSLRPPVGCLDFDCWARRCMWPGEDKGTFSQGQGYTSYHKVPIPVCMTRHMHGCPTEGTEIRANGDRYGKLLEPDIENARCCARPAYQGSSRLMRTCANCGKSAPPRAARLLNALLTKL